MTIEQNFRNFAPNNAVFGRNRNISPIPAAEVSENLHGLTSRELRPPNSLTPLFASARPDIFANRQPTAAQMPHEEWLASLEPEIRRMLDTAEHLANACSEERTRAVENAKDFLELEEYFEQLRERFGEGLRTINTFPPNIDMLFVESQSSTESNQIVVIFGRSTELFVDVPAHFTSEQLQRMLNSPNSQLVEFLKHIRDSEVRIPDVRLKQMFEEFFAKLFPES